MSSVSFDCSRLRTAFLIGIMATGLIAANGPGASAAACTGWTAPVSGKSTTNFLQAVSATSPCNAWAVGIYNAPAQTLIERWNGKTWNIQKSPDPAGSSGSTHVNYLFAVRATSSTNAWAVGDDSTGTGYHTLIAHWNGTAWKAQKSVDPGTYSNNLFGVAATSAVNAWAVGHYTMSATGAPDRTLIEHWNGQGWQVQKSPNPGGTHSTDLVGVAATSATNAWAVGAYTNSSGSTVPMVLHWNGTGWKLQKNPNPGSATQNNYLTAIAAVSPVNAWAVGYYNKGAGVHTLVEHWNGSAWKLQRSPNPSPAELESVTATSPTNAWAVGAQGYPGGPLQTLILHWSGGTWQIQKSPDPGGAGNQNSLTGISATSATNAWAVGGYSDGTIVHTLGAHWNGLSWKG